MASLLTNTGIAKYNNAINGGSHTPPQHLGWGTGTNAASASDTDLQTAASPARTSGTKSVQTTDVTDDTYQVVGTITAGGTLAITEVGLFDGAGTGDPASGANLYVRGVFSAINLASGDAIQFTVKIKIAQP